MTENHFAKGIAFTSFPYKGYTINVTCRDGGKDEAEASMLAIMDILNEVVLPSSMEDALEVPYDEKPVTLEGVTGMDLGLLERAPKAADFKQGQVYEILVDEYRIRDGSIGFYKKGLDFALCTHKLNEQGMKKMTEVFKTDRWGEKFVASEERQAMPGGDLIIGIIGGNLNSKDNPYKDLHHQRRP